MSTLIPQSLKILDDLIAKLQTQGGFSSKQHVAGGCKKNEGGNTCEGNEKKCEKKEKKEKKEGDKNEGEKKEEKKKEEKKEKKPHPELPDPATVEYKDPTPDQLELFEKVELKVGKLIEVVPVDKSDKLYQTKIDFGDHQRQVLTGLQQCVPIAQMTGLVVVFTNLKPRKMMGLDSNGMIIVASRKPNAYDLVRPDPSTAPGTRILLDNIKVKDDAAMKELNPELLGPFIDLLHSDAKGVPSFGTAPLAAGGKPLLVSTIPHANIT